MKEKIAVAMSGGVDSSVAAALLIEQGYQVSGIIMKLWDGAVQPGVRLSHACYGPDEASDIEDARAVAQKLGISLHVIDLASEYKTEVLDYFCAEYMSGRTPNPCLICNRRIKFQALIEKAQQTGLEFDRFASGHYARVELNRNNGRYLLKKGIDSKKDQSYFLSFLTQAQLSRLVLPLGDLTKVEVRKMAARFGMPVAEKPDSQNFVAEGYASILGEARPGLILDKSGKELGQHKGIQFYTIGQRKGLGISSKIVLYIIAIDPARNVLVVGEKDEVYGRKFTAFRMNWIAFEILDKPAIFKAKIRSSHSEAAAEIIPIDENIIEVIFKEPQLAITPGQAVVFYDSDTVVGAGIIESVVK